MKYLFTALLLTLIYSVQAQTQFGVKVGIGESDDRLVAFEKKVDFLMRDCTETHRRLDSLIGEMKNSQWRGPAWIPPDTPIYLSPYTPGSRLDSLWKAGDLKSLQPDGGLFPDSHLIVTVNSIFTLIPDSTGHLYHVGRNRGSVLGSGWGDNAMGITTDSTTYNWPEQTKITISNETPSAAWRHVDHSLYQVRGYIIYDNDGKPIYFDRHKKPFPKYIKIWP